MGFTDRCEHRKVFMICLHEQFVELNSIRAPTFLLPEPTTTTSPRGARDAVNQSPNMKRAAGGPEAFPPPPPPFTTTKRSRGEDLLEERERELRIAQDSTTTTAIDDRTLRRMVGALEKRVNANLQLRLKYPDQPEKFMESEVDLDAELKGLQSLATSPEFYPTLIRLDAVPLLLGLLAHENTSITRDVVLLLSELLDGDSVEDRLQEALALTNALVENKVTSLLSSVLSRCSNELGDQEEADCVYHTLSLIENMVDLKPQLADDASGPILKWLVDRIRSPDSDSNRTYASEVLAILLQTSDKNKEAVVSSNGVEALLQAIAKFRKADPADAEEGEFLENVFDGLCATAMWKGSKAELLRTEAVNLLLIVARKSQVARLAAMKAANFALTGSPALCDHFITALGLGPLFAFFMGKGFDAKAKAGGSRRKMAEEAREMQGHVISILASLLDHASKGTKRNRVLAKFLEKDCEKLDRLIEVWSECSEKLPPSAEATGAATEDDQEDEEEYLDLLDQGLYQLQQVALVVAYLWASGDETMQKRLLFVMHQYGHTLQDVSAVLARQFKFMYEVQGTETVNEGVDQERKIRLQKLIAILNQS